MILAKNRASFATIYIHESEFENYDSSVWFAAEYLRYYLSRITVAPFEIKTSDESGEAGIYIELKKSFCDDEFSIKSENDRLYINGGKRGVLYGVYELLEMIGCRFFTPECEKIPTITELEIPDIYKREKPVFVYRETDYCSTTGKAPKYATMCRLNGASNNIPEELGGHTKYALFAHTFGILVPPEDYFADHPEYYALIDGKRDAGDHTEW